MGKKKVAALFAAAALSFAACSSGDKEDAGSTGTTAADTTADDTMTDESTTDDTMTDESTTDDTMTDESTTDDTMTDESGAEATGDSMAEKECPTEGLTTLKVAVLGIYTDAALDWATNNCFLADQGVAVELVTVPAPPAAIAALTGGEVDIAYSPSIPVVRAYDSGAPVQALAPADGYTQELIDEFGSKLDDTAVYLAEPIDSAADLEGKTVAVPARGAQLEVTTASAVKDAGGDPSKVNFVALDLPNMIDAVKSGEIDAAALVSPFTLEAADAGLVDSGITAVDFFGPGAVGIWTTTADALSEKGDALRGFRTAIEASNADATAHPEEFWEVASARTEVPLEVYQDAGISYSFPDTVTTDDFSKVATKLFDLGFLENEVDVSAIIAE